MRTVQLNPSFGVEHLTVEQKEKPVVGPGQLLLRMTAASLNYRDLLMVRGHYNPRQPLPLVPCSDGVGWVERVGCRIGLSDHDRGLRIAPHVAVCDNQVSCLARAEVECVRLVAPRGWLVGHVQKGSVLGSRFVPG